MHACGVYVPNLILKSVDAIKTHKWNLESNLMQCVIHTCAHMHAHKDSTKTDRMCQMLNY